MASPNLFPGLSPYLVNAYLSAFDVRGIYGAADDELGPSFCNVTADGMLRKAPGSQVFAVWCAGDDADRLHGFVTSSLVRRAAGKANWYRLGILELQAAVDVAARDAGIAVVPHDLMARRVAGSLARLNREFEALKRKGGLREFNARFKAEREAGSPTQYAHAVDKFKEGILRSIADRERAA